jgi:Xaa-Pro aminopeptidase
VRRPKDDVELERMRVRRAGDQRRLRRGRGADRAGTQRARAQIELEAAFLRNGADTVAYDSIVGGGPNAAVLHFPPSGRPLRTASWC